MSSNKPESVIKVVDRATALMVTITRFSKPVNLKVLSAASIHAHRILHSLIENRFVERESNGEYWLANDF